MFNTRSSSRTWNDHEVQHQTVDSSHKDHVLLMLDSVARLLLPNAHSGCGTPVIVWETMSVRDVRFVLLGQESTLK